MALYTQLSSLVVILASIIPHYSYTSLQNDYKLLDGKGAVFFYLYYRSFITLMSSLLRPFYPLPSSSALSICIIAQTDGHLFSSA